MSKRTADGSNGRAFDETVDGWDRDVDGWRLRAARVLGDLIASETEGELSAFVARESGQVAPLETTAVIAWRRVLENVYVAICEPTERRSELLRAALVAMGGEIADAKRREESPRAGAEMVGSVEMSVPLIGASEPPAYALRGQSASSPWATNRQASPAPAAVVPSLEPLSAPLPQPDESLDETSELDLAMLAHVAATPFVPATPGAQTALKSFPSSPEEDAASDFAGQTSTIDPASIADVVAAYPLPVKLPMALERYAALVARSEGASESELVELHREYGVSDAAHRKRIDQEFSVALSRDNDLRRQFGDHLRQGRDWLRRQRGGS